MSRYQDRSRRGFSLTELSAAMAAGSTLMMLAVGMLHQAFLWSSTAKHRAEDDRRFDRLQRQFRTDVHAADQATLQQELSQQLLSLTTADERIIIYTVTTSDTVQRREQTPQGDLNEAFPWSNSLQIKLSQQHQPHRLVLSARRIPAVAKQPPIWRHVEAVVGFANRHTKNEVKP